MTLELQSIRAGHEFLKQLGGTTRADDHVAMLRLAAHLYAVATYLWRHERSGRMMRAQAPLIAGWEQALRVLRDSSVSNPTELYVLCVGVLEAIDGGFEHTVFVGWTPRPVDLQALPGWPDLGRRVRASIRPRARWTQLRIRRREKASSHMHYKEGPAEYLGTLSLLLQEGNTTSVELLTQWHRLPLVQAPASWLDQREFRVALCPLMDDAGACFQVLDSGDQFTVNRKQPIYSRAKLEEHLRALMRMAAREQVHLMVLPELSVDEPLRALLQEEMRRTSPESLLAIFAGSFHIWRTQDEQQPFNEAVVLSRSRHGPLWTHEKQGYFRVTRKQLQTEEMRALFTFPSSQLCDEVSEGIQHGSTLRLLDTSLGRLCVVICADVLEPLAPFRSLLLQARPDLLLIVSMSPKTEVFFDYAEQMARAGTSVLFVNSSSSCQTDQALAFAVLDVAQLPGAPFTRLRWRKGSTLVEILNPQAKAQGWMTTPSAGKSADLASEGALIVNLGAYFDGL